MATGPNELSKIQPLSVHITLRDDVKLLWVFSCVIDQSEIKHVEKLIEEIYS